VQAHCTCVRNSVAIEHTLDSTTTECVLNQITCRLLGVPQLMRYTAYHVTASPFVEYRVTAFLGLLLTTYVARSGIPIHHVRAFLAFDIPTAPPRPHEGFLLHNCGSKQNHIFIYIYLFAGSGPQPNLSLVAGDLLRPQAPLVAQECATKSP
jgi:hypothetical protein